MNQAIYSSSDPNHEFVGKQISANDIICDIASRKILLCGRKFCYR